MKIFVAGATGAIGRPNASSSPQVSVEEALQIGGTDTVYYGIQMRGVSNAKAKRELNFQPRSLEWLVGSTLAYASQRSSIRKPFMKGAQ